jgi:hypothetical protein
MFIILVKAGFQFYQHQHALSVLRGLDQRLHHLAAPAHPVQRHLDGHHCRVPGSLLQKSKKGFMLS